MVWSGLLLLRWQSVAPRGGLLRLRLVLGAPEVGVGCARSGLRALLLRRSRLPRTRLRGFLRGGGPPAPPSDSAAAGAATGARGRAGRGRVGPGRVGPGRVDPY